MDDEVNELLGSFLEVASGERTAPTRARYAQTLDLLRLPGVAPHGDKVAESATDTPAVRLLLRIPPILAAMDDDDGIDPEVRRTAPSLWGRLVTWLARNTDAGSADARCLMLEAGAASRRAAARNTAARQEARGWGWAPQWQQPQQWRRDRYDIPDEAEPDDRWDWPANEGYADGRGTYGRDDYGRDTYGRDAYGRGGYGRDDDRDGDVIPLHREER